MLVSWVADTVVTEPRVTLPGVTLLVVSESRVAGCRVLDLVMGLVLDLVLEMMLRHDVHWSLIFVSQVSWMTYMRCHWAGARAMGTCHVLAGEVATGFVRSVRNLRNSRVNWLVMHVSCKLVMVLMVLRGHKCLLLERAWLKGGSTMHAFKRGSSE